MKETVREALRKLDDWRLTVVGGLTIVLLTSAALALGVDRPVRGAVQIGIGVVLVAWGVYDWRQSILDVSIPD